MTRKPEQPRRRRKTPAQRAQDRLQVLERLHAKAADRDKRAAAEQAAAAADLAAVTKRLEHARTDPDLPAQPEEKA